MDLSESDYLGQLRGLLPPGPAWPKEDDAWDAKILGAFAAEFARADARARNLIDEADPRSTIELFQDFERITGLPDACAEAFGDAQTVSKRRAALLAKLTTIGGQTPQYFIELAATLGYSITITEFQAHTVISSVTHPLYSAEWHYVWQVNASLINISRADVLSYVNDPLASWGNSFLECVINRFKPAHTFVIYSYT